MKNFKSLFKSIPAIIVSVIVVAGITYAGNLTPPGSPSAQSYTLSDIYNRLSTNATTTAGSHSLSTTTAPASTFHTLTDIYNAIPSIDATKILSGTTYLGVAGSASVGPAPLTWQTDPNLSLCWSHGSTETGGGCVIGNGFLDMSAARDGSNPVGAVEYCTYLQADGVATSSTQQNIWRLPTMAEYNSITDFSLSDNATQVQGFVQGSIYWSSTIYAPYSDDAWSWGPPNGSSFSYYRSNQNQVRCVRG